jgi:hypothetical protein
MDPLAIFDSRGFDAAQRAEKTKTQVKSMASNSPWPYTIPVTGCCVYASGIAIPSLDNAACILVNS